MRIILGTNTDIDLEWRRFCYGCRFLEKRDGERRCTLFHKALANNATPPRLDECWKAERED